MNSNDRKQIDKLQEHFELLQSKQQDMSITQHEVLLELKAMGRRTEETQKHLKDLLENRMKGLEKDVNTLKTDVKSLMLRFAGFAGATVIISGALSVAVPAIIRAIYG